MTLFIRSHTVKWSQELLGITNNSVNYPAGWGCRIRQLHLCRGVRRPLMRPPADRGWRLLSARTGSGWFNKEPSTSNQNSFKLLRAKARKTIKLAKRICWQHYVNQLNSSTKTTSVENDQQNYREKLIHN